MSSGWTSFDSANAAITEAAYTLAPQTEQEIAGISGMLINLYQGNQLPYVRAHLAGLLKSQELLERYQKHAITHNMTRLIVDRIATVGQALPVRVVMTKKLAGEPYPKAQKRWDEVAENRMGDAPWDTFVPGFFRFGELCKNVVASVTWDDEIRGIALDRYTPNVMTVDYSNAQSKRRLRPDIFRILMNGGTGAWQHWDFRDRSEGASGIVYQGNQDGAAASENEAVPVIDPRTKRSLVPFVTFRTDLPSDNYWVRDGQQEFVTAQLALNVWYTLLNVLLHFGAFQIPVLSGGGWIDKEGIPPTLLMDPSEFFVEPSGAFGEKSELSFKGPANAENVKSIMEVIRHWVDAAAAANRINPRAITASNEPASGYSLLVESAALRQKHATTRTLAQLPLERIVEKVITTWNYYCPLAERFPDDADFSVIIPDYGSGVMTNEETQNDVLRMEKGLTSRRALVFKHNPGMTAVETDALIDRFERDNPIGSLAGRGISDLVSLGVVTKDEARGMVDLPPLPPSDVVDATKESTSASPLVAGPAADVQQQALNGAQMTSLQGIVQSVADGNLPLESAIRLVRISIPTISEQEAKDLVVPASTFTKRTPASEPKPGAAPISGQVPPQFQKPRMPPPGVEPGQAPPAGPGVVVPTAGP